MQKFALYPVTFFLSTEGTILFRFEFPIRMITGMPFRQSVITADNAYVVVVTVDKSNKDCLGVYSTTNGAFVTKVLLKGCAIKVSFPITLRCPPLTHTSSFRR